MKILKYIIITFLFFILSSFDNKIGGEIETYANWRHSGYGYWTNSGNYSIYNDFDWSITKQFVKGYYFFDFWFFSQSYYWNGYTPQYTTTNITYIDVYVDGKLYLSDRNQLGVNFLEKYRATTLRIVTNNPYPKIYFTWGSMSAK